ncbi:hypothetical protein ACFE04_016632 [Oxalis oulophora]
MEDYSLYGDMHAKTDTFLTNVLKKWKGEEFFIHEVNGDRLYKLLDTTTWVDDQVVAFYGKLLREQKDFAFFDPTLFRFIVTGYEPKRGRLQYVKKKKSHWFLLVATVKTRKVQVFYSLGKHSELQKIMEWVEHILNDSLEIQTKWRFQISEVELARKCIVTEIFLGKLAEPSNFPLFLKERNSSSAHHRIATEGSCWKYFFCRDLLQTSQYKYIWRLSVKIPIIISITERVRFLNLLTV